MVVILNAVAYPRPSILYAAIWTPNDTTSEIGPSNERNIMLLQEQLSANILEKYSMKGESRLCGRVKKA